MNTNLPTFLTCGVTQGCLHSLLLIALTLEALLQRIRHSHRVLGFPLPGAGTVAVTAYTDDVTFVRS